MGDEYVNGFLAGWTGDCAYLERSDINLILERVLKPSSHDEWWGTKMVFEDGVEDRPMSRWIGGGQSGRTQVVKQAVSYLDPSFG